MEFHWHSSILQYGVKAILGIQTNKRAMEIFCEVLNSNYLEELKKENAERVKPSKSILEALKYATRQTKDLKDQLKRLQAEMETIKHENQVLNQTVSQNRLREGLEITQLSPQQKSLEEKKILEAEVKRLQLENDKLKRELESLKSKVSKYDDTYSSEMNSQINIETQGSEFKRSEDGEQKQRCWIADSQSNSGNNCGESMVQSAKFNEYVSNTTKGPDSPKGKTEKSTKPNSKTIIGSIGSQEDRVLNQDIPEDQNNNLEVLKKMFSFEPKDTRTIGTDKCNKAKSKSTEKIMGVQQKSNASGFANPQDQAHLGKDISRPPVQEYTFLNIETKKSIDHFQESCHVSFVQNVAPNGQSECSNSDRLSLDCSEHNESSQRMQLLGGDIHRTTSKLDSQEETLQNLSNCDYSGLLDDIYQGVPKDEHQPEQDQFSNANQSDSRSQKSGQSEDNDHLNLKDVIYKQTSSQILDDRTEKGMIRRACKKPTIVQKIESIEFDDDNMEDRYFMEKYMNDTESYKTIVADSKSGERLDSERSETMPVNFNNLEAAKENSEGSQKQDTNDEGFSPQITINSKAFQGLSEDADNSLSLTASCVPSSMIRSKNKMGESKLMNNSSRLMSNSTLMKFSNCRLNKNEKVTCIKNRNSQAKNPYQGNLSEVPTPKAAARDKLTLSSTSYAAIHRQKKQLQSDSPTNLVCNIKRSQKSQVVSKCLKPLENRSMVALNRDNANGQSAVKNTQNSPVRQESCTDQSQDLS